MIVEQCPGCRHPRGQHRGGSCIDCFSCNWVPVIYTPSGKRGWRYAGQPVFDTVAAIKEAARLVGYPEE